MLPNPVVSELSGHLDPLSSNPLISPYDTQMHHERQMSSDIESDFRNYFSGKLHADLIVESNFYDQYY